ncbi:hypothetical protein [Bacillus toyonensis]|uniref:hypothetical protein n=1 Tax=Bacillus toyonensis TaxID=155322 RepID=UPI000BF088E0|nr:hypothetical protein [Bacillus toyonensis]PEJ67606.1 hypothetical protein CN906_00925 [Bacillus toyonensis]PEN73960.1 hypothetical protein CN545_00590 [Bacillus toyonensis]PGB05556.1 hypothetical protein COL96_27680 [Bacillus toyonensis]PGB36481.1 hypothetical protein COM16_00020 [Bacillus toyonensis]
MLNLVHNETQPTFFERFFFENPVQNDVFIIEVNKKYFFFEYDAVIDMIKRSNTKQQEYVKRQLQNYHYLSQDLRTCLQEIATDYIRRIFGENPKMECKVVPPHSIQHMNYRRNLSKVEKWRTNGS